MDDFAQLLYALCTCKQSISGKMAFKELLVIVLSFWLRSRRARKRRAIEYDEQRHYGGFAMQ